MADRWELYLGQRRILSGKYDLPEKLLTLFKESDKYLDRRWAESIDQLYEREDDTEWSELQRALAMRGT